jgi:hypothetical protein
VKSILDKIAVRIQDESTNPPQPCRFGYEPTCPNRFPRALWFAERELPEFPFSVSRVEQTERARLCLHSLLHGVRSEVHKKIA